MLLGLQSDQSLGEINYVQSRWTVEKEEEKKKEDRLLYDHVEKLTNITTGKEEDKSRDFLKLFSYTAGISIGSLWFCLGRDPKHHQVTLHEML